MEKDIKKDKSKSKNRNKKQKSNPVKISVKNRRLKPLDDEVWKFIKSTNQKYAISNYGRVKSFVLYEDGRIIKAKDVRGFNVVVIKLNSKNKTCLVHRLVAEQFVPRENPNQTKVTHIDWNLKNNHYTNLKWLSLEESLKRVSVKNKGKTWSGKIYITNTNLKEKDIVVLKQMLNRGIKQNVIAKLFHISEMQVTRIKRGENWKNVKVPEENL